jgi:hypothetical protein
MVAVSLIALLGIAALAVDIGYLYHAQNELQVSTNAAATAGALDLSNNLSASQAVTDANLWSGISGGKNAYKDLPGVTMVSPAPKGECLTYLTNLGLACNNAAGDNAFYVKQQVTVPTFFAKLFHINSLTLTATALAAMKGGTPAPANIVVVMDTTHSMGPGSTGNCTITGLSNPTRLDCAKAGLRTLLGELSPCAAGLTSCGTVTGGNVPNAVDEVGLLVFPGLTATSYASDDYTNCGKTDISSYIAPYASASSSPPYFTIVSPSSDYRSSDTATSLNGGTSNLVQAIDWQDGNNCQSSQYGLQAPGGVGTYYAGVIAEAQADLSAITTAPRSTMQNAIIFLSDGDANATSGDFTAASLKANPALDSNECTQAITAATNAAGLKTWVYSIAYGASTSTSGSCSTDNGAQSGCSTMTAIASDASKFYSDNASGCISTAHPSMTDLSNVFQNIGYDFLSTRLLPSSALNNGTP